LILPLSAFASLPEYQAALAETRPDLMLIDADLRGCGEFDCCISQIRRDMPSPPPFIVISSSHQMQLRLRAMRAGVSQFFTKPLDSAKLARAILRLVKPPLETARWVMIGCDDAACAASYTRVLRDGGIESSVAASPEELLLLLGQQNATPDVMILDFRGQEEINVELAAALRLDEEQYGLLPILFISDDSDAAERLSTARNGGIDGLLRRSPEPQELLAVARIRIQSARRLRQLSQNMETAYSAQRHSGLRAIDGTGLRAKPQRGAAR
jgi:PleD family two-component response regulator